MIYQNYKIVIVLFIASFFIGCSSSRQENISLYDQKNFLPKDEKRLITRTKIVKEKINEHESVMQDREYTAYPNRILKELLRDDNLNIHNDINFQINIIENPMLNAFAMADGSIYIHTGLLSKMENEDQLALLIGHEMSHVIYKHTIKQRRDYKDTLFYSELFHTVTSVFGIVGDLASLMTDIGLTSAIMGYSKEHEMQADDKGMKQLVAAGYDPKKGAKLFEIMLKDIEEKEIEEPFFFSTHPRVQERIDNFQSLIKEKYSNAQANRINNDEFRSYIKPIIIKNITLEFKLKRTEHLLSSIESFALKYPNSAYADFFKGEFIRHSTEKDQDILKKEYEIAFKRYSKAIQKDVNLFKAYRGIGLLNMKIGNNKDAKEAFETYLSMNTNAKDKMYIKHYIKLCEKNKGK